MKINELIQEEIKNYLEETPDGVYYDDISTDISDSGGFGSQKTAFDQPQNLKYRQALRQEGEELDEDASQIEQDGKVIFYRSPGTFPFAVLTKNGEVFVGEQQGSHGSTNLNIDGSNVTLRTNGWFNMQGRLFSDQKVLAFWTVPQKDKLKNIIDQLNQKTQFNLLDGSWKIQVDDPENPSHDGFGLDYLPLTEYLGVETPDRGGREQTRLEKILEMIHTMSPTKREQLKPIYLKLKQQVDKLDNEQMEVFKALDRVFGGKGFGSDKYAKEKPLAYRQALRQESDRKWYGDGVEEIINDEIQSLGEDPDGSYHPDVQDRLTYSESGAYAFGYTDNLEFMISREKGTHGDLQDSSGINYGREGVRYGGRIWTVDNVISFWEYPPPHMIREIAQDLENELGVNIINNPNFIIETLTDVVGEPIWDDDDYFKSDEMHWAKSDDREMLTVPEYEKLGEDQIQQRSAEELAKQHELSPMLKTKKEPIKGSGSSKYGTQKPLAYRQALVRSESLEDIVKDEVKLQENPDSITDYTGMFRYKDEIQWNDKGAYAFGYLDDNMIVSDESETHEQLGGNIEKRTFRRDYTYAGRIWTNDKIISFWEYPPPNMILKVIRDLRKALHININNDYKIETLPNKISGDKLGSNIGPYDWMYKSAEGENVKPVFLTPTEYSKFGEVQQRSKEELATQHIASPLQKPHTKPIKGSGSSKYGTQKPLAYRQALMRSEGEELEESPDEINLPDGQLTYHVKNAYAFGYSNGVMKVSYPNKTHIDIGGSRADMQYPGRLWTNQKMISFWEYPQPSEIRKVLSDIENASEIKIDDTWSIETLPDTVGKEAGRGVHSDWKEKEVYGTESSAQYLSPSQYEQLGSVGQRSPEELAKDHELSPMLKSKKQPIKGSGSSKYGTKRPLPMRQALVRSESDNIFEQVEKILKEWEDPNADWIHDMYEMRDEIMRETIQDFMEKPPTARQPWKVVPFPRLKKIWEDAAKMNIVRDTKGLQEIQERMVRNLLKLDVNTEILGHSQAYPTDEVEDLGYTMEQFEAKIGDWSNVYFESPNGQLRLSDYGLKPLWKYAEQLIKATDPIQKIQYIDQMLNVVHMRSDLAENFIQGGTSSLDALFNGEQEREYEVHRPM